MDSGTCLDTLKHGEDVSQPSVSNVEGWYQTRGIEGAANSHSIDIEELRPSTWAPGHQNHNDNERNASIGPTTPDCGTQYHCASPLTLFLTLPKSVSIIKPHSNSYPSSPDHIQGLCVCTPKYSVFGPFAPGRDTFLLASHPTKYIQESGDNVVRRQLTFGESTCCCIPRTNTVTAISEEEEILFQTVYKSLLEAIISMQTKGIPSPRISLSQTSVVVDGFATPCSATGLSVVAETCPGAPVKLSRKITRIQKGLCRRLEF